MKKIIILVPVFNDWESVSKLLNEISKVIQNIKGYEFKCIIINDASSVSRPKIFKPNYIKSLTIINMIKNRGHARCNAFGVRYVESNEKFDYLILMDADGEDKPEDILNFINKIKIKPNFSVVAKRVRRSEGSFFQAMYKIHKIVTYIFTGQKIDFGNYTCLTKQDVKDLSDKASLWSSYSGSFKKNLKQFNEIESIRGLRYYGRGKMSFFNLTMHSFSIIAVFKYYVFLRSSFAIVVLSFLNNFVGVFSSLIQILLVIFNLLIFIVSLRENKKALIESHLNVLDIKDIKH